MFQIDYVQYQNVAIFWVKGISEVFLVWIVKFSHDKEENVIKQICETNKYSNIKAIFVCFFIFIFKLFISVIKKLKLKNHLWKINF
jgi:hypothetical protein